MTPKPTTGLTPEQSRVVGEYAEEKHSGRLCPAGGRAVAHTPAGLFLHVQRWLPRERRWSNPYVLVVDQRGLGYKVPKSWEEVAGEAV